MDDWLNGGASEPIEKDAAEDIMQEEAVGSAGEESVAEGYGGFSIPDSVTRMPQEEPGRPVSDVMADGLKDSLPESEWMGASFSRPVADMMMPEGMENASPSGEMPGNPDSRPTAEGPADIDWENRDGFTEPSENAEPAAESFVLPTEPLGRESESFQSDQVSSAEMRDVPLPRRPYVSPYDAYRFNGGTRPVPGTESADNRQTFSGAGSANSMRPGTDQPTERANGNPASTDGRTYPSWRTQPLGSSYGQPGYGQGQPAAESRREAFAGNGGGYGQGQPAAESRKEAFAGNGGGYGQGQPAAESRREAFAGNRGGYGQGQPAAENRREAFAGNGGGGYGQGQPYPDHRKDSFTGNNGGGFGPGGPNGPEKPKKKGGAGKKIAAILGFAALFGLVAALVFFGMNRLMGGFLQFSGTSKSVTEAPEQPKVTIGSNDRDTESRQPAGRSDMEESEGGLEKLPDTVAAAPEGGELSVPDVVELTMPSMVAITNTSISEYRSLFGERGQYENVSTGSGIVVGETDTDYLIATNDHVISDANKITVTFIDDSVVEGEVSASDNRNDLAIVSVKKDKIEKETLEKIRIIAIGNSDELRVGETVIAIGNALGYGQSVSRGVVSALNRTVEVDGVTHELIQTDASINPGNSGGALINLRGELVGINEVKAVDTKVEGVGYAIPMATAKPILENLGTKAARKKVDEEHASYIGIHCMTMSNYYVQMGYPAGAYVSDVMKDGPAEAAGLKEGDIITAIDGSSVTTSTQLITYLEYYAAGEKVNFTVKRLNEAQNGFDVLDIEITLGNKNDANFEAPGEVG